jgi:hypothetical protein
MNGITTLELLTLRYRRHVTCCRSEEHRAVVQKGGGCRAEARRLIISNGQVIREECQLL